MPIFFNVKRVRKFLMLHGEVFTIRKNARNLVTNAVEGSFYKQKKIAKVQVKFILDLKDESDIKPYVEKSGFKLGSAWLKKARLFHQENLVLHHVKILKKFLPWKFAPWMLEHLESRFSNMVFMGYNRISFIMSSADGEATSQIIPHLKDTLPEDKIVNDDIVEALDRNYDILLIDKPVLNKTIVENNQKIISDYFLDPQKTKELFDIED